MGPVVNIMVAMAQIPPVSNAVANSHSIAMNGFTDQREYCRSGIGSAVDLRPWVLPSWSTSRNPTSLADGCCMVPPVVLNPVFD